jgi:serine/threonine protein kinase
MRLGTLSGKLGYLAPEQASGGIIDARSDLFALGLVMRECLTLTPVYPAGDPSRTLDLARRADIASLAAECPQLDAQIVSVLGRLLARDPALRFQRADEVEAALTPIVRRLQADAAGLRAFVESALRDEDTQGHLVLSPPTAPALEGRRARRASPSRPWLQLVADLVVLVTTAIALRAPGPLTPVGQPFLPAAPAHLSDVTSPLTVRSSAAPLPGKPTLAASSTHKKQSRREPAGAARRARPFARTDDSQIVSGPELRNPFVQ